MSTVARLLAEADAFHRAGRLHEAEQAGRRAIQADPANALGHNFLGLVLAAQGKPDEAIAWFQSAVERNPDDAQAHNNLGVTFERLGRLDEAATSFRRAVQLRPDYAEAHNNLGVALGKLGHHDEAVACCRRALELKPDNVDAHNSLGVALERQEKLDEAAACFRQVVKRKPDDAEAHSNLAAILDRQDRLDEAMASLERALALNPNSPEAHVNLGMVLERQGQMDPAITSFRRAIELDPNGAQAHLNYGLALLRRGHFESGWREYEWRAGCEGVVQPVLPAPRWRGEPLEGKTILLVEEQGAGDTLHFVRYAEPLKSRGATVIVQCRPQLASLLKSCRGIDAVIPTAAPPPAFDVYLPLPSAPGVFGTTLESIPANVPYLFADAALLGRWQAEFNTVGEFKVGIAWQGDPNHKANRYRSIPLERFVPLAGVPGVRLFSLQFGAGREQLAELPPACPITDLGDRLGDFDNTGAIMRSLDLVITCDSAPAHLAGALGVPVWVALVLVPDWRWLLERTDSPWYPTMRLYRQSRVGDWHGVFDGIERDLRAIAGQRG